MLSAFVWGQMTQAQWVCRWRFRLKCMKHLLFHDSASPPVCQCSYDCSFWHILSLRWFSCMRSCCFCSKRHHRKMPSLFLDSHLCLYLLLKFSQIVVKDSNFHKNLCMQEATPKTGGSVIFVTTNHYSLIQALVNLCLCKEIADNSVNLYSNKMPTEVIRTHSWKIWWSVSDLCFDETNSSSQSLDIWFVTIQV